MAFVFSWLLNKIVHTLRASRWRKSLLRWLLSTDNFLRRWITFFAFENGLHPKHRILNYHQFFIDHIQNTDTVLDVGCGIGYLAHDVAAKAMHVTGIDTDGPSLTKARAQYQRPNMTFLQGDATTYIFEQTYNVIILSNVLEHIKDRPAFLKKLGAVAPRLLIRVPMIDRDWVVLLKKELGIEYRLDPTHFTEFTESQFREETSEGGLIIDSLSVRFGEIYAVLSKQ